MRVVTYVNPQTPQERDFSQLECEKYLCASENCDKAPRLDQRVGERGCGSEGNYLYQASDHLPVLPFALRRLATFRIKFEFTFSIS